MCVKRYCCPHNGLKDKSEQSRSYIRRFLNMIGYFFSWWLRIKIKAKKWVIEVTFNRVFSIQSINNSFVMVLAWATSMGMPIQQPSLLLEHLCLFNTPNNKTCIKSGAPQVYFQLNRHSINSWWLLSYLGGFGID